MHGDIRQRCEVCSNPADLELLKEYEKRLGFARAYNSDTMAMEEEDSYGNTLYEFSAKTIYTHGHYEQYLFYFQMGGAAK